jgi:transposase
MNCENITFSQQLCNQRIAPAEALLGSKVVRKILGYALFLLGATRSTIASFLDMPPGSVRSLVLAMHKKGLSALEDQRSGNSSFKPPTPQKITPELKEHDTCLRVNFGIGALPIDIPVSNTTQKKVVILTLLQNGLLKSSEAAKALDLSADRAGKLAKALQRNDVEAILDHRRGQQQDYRFTPDIKAELIQQFVIDIVVHGKTSGDLLAQHLNKRCGLTLSPRSILNHVSALGLSRIKSSLPVHLTELKKKF